MKAFHVVFQNKNIASYSEFSLSDPKDDEILVRSAYSLISSGTEKAQLAGMPNTPCKFPFIPGYSIVGTIEKVGKKFLTSKKETVYLSRIVVTVTMSSKKHPIVSTFLMM